MTKTSAGGPSDRQRTANTIVELALAFMQQGLDASPEGEIRVSRGAIDSYANEPKTTRIDLGVDGEDIILRRTRVGRTI